MCNTMGVVYKGVGGWKGAGVVGVSGQAEGQLFLPSGHRQWHCVLSRQQGCT